MASETSLMHELDWLREVVPYILYPGDERLFGLAKSAPEVRLGAGHPAGSEGAGLQGILVLMNL